METSVNNKCKAFTSLEQSKKLSEIVPIESADLYYPNRIGSDSYPLPIKWKRGLPLLSQEIPCWSLAALLSVLPDYTLQTNSDGTVFVVCDSKKPMISDAYNNPVDTCVDMIEKLNELNML